MPGSVRAPLPIPLRWRSNRSRHTTRFAPASSPGRRGPIGPRRPRSAARRPRATSLLELPVSSQDALDAPASGDSRRLGLARRVEEAWARLHGVYVAVRGVASPAVARILIVGGGCRGRCWLSDLIGQGHAVRITTRGESGRAAIEATGAECRDRHTRSSGHPARSLGRGDDRLLDARHGSGRSRAGAGAARLSLGVVSRPGDRHDHAWLRV